MLDLSYHYFGGTRLLRFYGKNGLNECISNFSVCFFFVALVVRETATKRVGRSNIPIMVGRMVLCATISNATKSVQE